MPQQPLCQTGILPALPHLQGGCEHEMTRYETLSQSINVIEVLYTLEEDQYFLEDGLSSTLLCSFQKDAVDMQTKSNPYQEKRIRYHRHMPPLLV